MAVSIQGPKGRRRALDASINLVPFIDLLSCCIAFLLITAVCSQVSALEAQVAPTPGSATLEPHEQGPPLPVLRVHRDGYSLGDATLSTTAELERGLRSIKADQMVVRADDDVAYGRLVDTIDRAKGAGFAVGVGDSGG